jgi:hypothetical protein
VPSIYNIRVIFQRNAFMNTSKYWKNLEGMLVWSLKNLQMLDPVYCSSYIKEVSRIARNLISFRTWIRVKCCCSYSNIVSSTVCQSLFFKTQFMRYSCFVKAFLTSKISLDVFLYIPINRKHEKEIKCFSSCIDLPKK